MVDLRRNLTSQWEEFVAEWCLGIEPAQPPVEVERALDALRRLWPESLDDLQAHGARGLTFVAGAIENGLTLATCKSLSGFGPVMKRLRGGEESALAELQFARALVRCGFRPVLEPDIGSKVLDCSIGIGSERVFAEVIAPEQAAGIKSAQDTIRRLATGVVERSRGTRTEVLLTVEPEARFDSILDARTSGFMKGGNSVGLSIGERTPRRGLNADERTHSSSQARIPCGGRTTLGQAPNPSAQRFATSS